MTEEYIPDITDDEMKTAKRCRMMLSTETIIYRLYRRFLLSSNALVVSCPELVE